MTKDVVIRLTDHEEDVLACIQSGFAMNDPDAESAAAIERLSSLGLIRQVWVAVDPAKTD